LHHVITGPDYCAFNRHRRLAYRDDGGRWLLACIRYRRGHNRLHNGHGWCAWSLTQRVLTRLGARHHENHGRLLLRACPVPVAVGGSAYSYRNDPYALRLAPPQHDEGGDSERRGDEDEHGPTGVETRLVEPVEFVDAPRMNSANAITASILPHTEYSLFGHHIFHA
jgi:hypothetical protein